jgi:RNA-directed DNA polymerase
LSEGRAGGTRPLLAKGISIKTTMEELAPYMRGWRGYFGFCETPEVLIALTRWVRLRLRAALRRQWKPGVAVVRP